MEDRILFIFCELLQLNKYETDLNNQAKIWQQFLCFDL